MIEFKAEHLKGFEIQDNQKSEMQIYLDHSDYPEILQGSGYGYSLFDGNTLIACGGLAHQSNSRALAWMLISRHVQPKHFVTITKNVVREIKQSSYPRIEAIVKDGFYQAHRFIKLLGFTCETPEGMVNWFNSGETAYLYSVIKCQAQK